MDFIFGALVSNLLIHKACQHYNTKINFEAAIEELNLRLRQHGLGYEFIGREIIKKSNTVTHEHIVKPTLKLFAGDENFGGTEKEYLLAFDY